MCAIDEAKPGGLRSYDVTQPLRLSNHGEDNTNLINFKLFLFMPTKILIPLKQGIAKSIRTRLLGKM